MTAVRRRRLPAPGSPIRRVILLAVAAVSLAVPASAGAALQISEPELEPT